MTRWPDGIIDPHIHQWDPLSTERVVSKEAHLFRRLPRIPRALRWVLPRADREFVGIGPDRTMWASNFPMDKPGLGIPGSIALLIEVLGDDADLDLLLRDVARQTYRISRPH